MKKSPVAPNVPISFVAQKTEGFSGADLAELCQRGAKAAIRDAIASEELKAGGVKGDLLLDPGFKSEGTYARNSTYARLRFPPPFPDPPQHQAWTW